MVEHDEDSKGFTKLYHKFYDEIMPLFPYPESGILMKIYRNTVGFNGRKSDYISISQFMKQLHIAHHQTIIDAIDRLDMGHFIIIEKQDRKISKYTIQKGR